MVIVPVAKIAPPVIISSAFIITSPSIKCIPLKFSSVLNIFEIFFLKRRIFESYGEYINTVISDK